MPRRIWPATFLVLVPAFAFSAVTVTPGLQAAVLDKHLAGSLTRASQFADVPHISAGACEEVRQPEALATPNPLFSSTSRGENVKISFIIGTDGHVHSPLILKSGGMAKDWHVLRTVRTWRYRPATCNGVPTETEGKIEFSSR